MTPGNEIYQQKLPRKSYIQKWIINKLTQLKIFFLFLNLLWLHVCGNQAGESAYLWTEQLSKREIDEAERIFLIETFPSRTKQLNQRKDRQKQHFFSRQKRLNPGTINYPRHHQNTGVSNSNVGKGHVVKKYSLPATQSPYFVSAGHIFV